MPTAVSRWPEAAPELAKELHRCLSLGDRDWHRLKTDADRRGAELMAAALSQLIQGGERHLSLIHISEPTRPY